MKIKIITIGAPSNEFATLFNEYIRRIGRFAKADAYHIKEGKDTDKKVLQAIGSTHCILLDEHGKQFSSKQLAEFLNKKNMGGESELAFIIGGPDGHTDAIRERADFVWSLTELTLPHDMAMVILAETLYRSLSIIAGHPYHRE